MWKTQLNWNANRMNVSGGSLFHVKTVHNLLLSARTVMWSMPVVLTEMENENDSANQNDVAKLMYERALAR